MPLPDEIRMALSERLDDLDIPGKMVPPDNWHVSLRFLGTVDLVTYERFLHGVTEIESESSFRIRLQGIGGFPKTSKASVVWLGVSEGDQGLARLNDIAEGAATDASLQQEERPFRPHLTLARVRPPQNVDHSSNAQIDFSWTAGEAVVYRSHINGGGARYEPLERLVLTR